LGGGLLRSPQQTALSAQDSSPSGYNLLGIANTGGDTIVVAAIEHHDESTPHGWMYINTCRQLGMSLPGTNKRSAQPDSNEWL